MKGNSQCGCLDDQVMLPTISLLFLYMNNEYAIKTQPGKHIQDVITVV